MAGKWRAYLGNLWGGFRVGSDKALALVSPGDLRISDNGTIELSARYDPPGSGWRALVAALITLVLIVLVAQATGGCAGPGWLLWYILIIFIRRQPVRLNLEKAESVVIDPATHRLAFLTNFLGAKSWVAFEIKENFDTVMQSISATIGTPLSEGKIVRRLRAATVFVLVSMILFVVLVFLSIFIYLMYRSTARPQIDVV